VILIGQYDSPFVRRVGIALTLYGIPFEHRPWSVFGDAEKIRPLNPLVRVPALALGDGTVLTDSHMMLDYLDNLVGPDRAMFPAREPARHRALRIATLATGLAEKAVSLFYEKRLHKQVSDAWVERCLGQMVSVLAVLEGERAQVAATYWFGGGIGHADIAAAVALRFVAEAHAGLIAMADYPALAAHAARLEALPVFQRIQQEFIPPA
jgi:glutathione S-transferase